MKGAIHMKRLIAAGAVFGAIIVAISSNPKIRAKMAQMCQEHALIHHNGTCCTQTEPEPEEEEPLLVTPA